MTFVVPDRDYFYVLPVDEASELLGTSPYLSFLVADASVRTSTVIARGGPTTAWITITASPAGDTPRSEALNTITESSMPVRPGKPASNNEPPPRSTTAGPLVTEAPAISSAKSVSVSSQGRSLSVTTNPPKSSQVTSLSSINAINKSTSFRSLNTMTPPDALDTGHSSSAALIRGAVGGALGGVIIILLGAMLLILRQHKKQSNPTTDISPSDFTEKPELGIVPSTGIELGKVWSSYEATWPLVTDRTGST